LHSSKKNFSSRSADNSPTQGLELLAHKTQNSLFFLFIINAAYELIDHFGIYQKTVCKITFCGSVELFAKAHILRVVGLFDVFRE
jgi:hypothetical protein